MHSSPDVVKLARVETGTPKTEHRSFTQVLTPVTNPLQDQRTNPLQDHISYTHDILHTSKTYYLHNLINNNHSTPLIHLTVFLYSVRISTLKIFDRSFQQTAHTLQNNRPPSMKTFASTTPNISERLLYLLFADVTLRNQFRSQQKLTNSTDLTLTF